MTNPWVIRRLLAADLNIWKSIRQQALKSAPLAFGRTLVSFAAQSDQDHVERLLGSTVYGAFAGDRIIGSAAWYPIDYVTENHRGKINSVFVSPDYQGQGVSDLLMAAIKQDAIGKVLQLELTVTVGQDRAIAFYQRQGFEIIGTLPRALCHDGVYSDEHMMVLNLKA